MEFKFRQRFNSPVSLVEIYFSLPCFCEPVPSKSQCYKEPREPGNSALFFSNCLGVVVCNTLDYVHAVDMVHCVGGPCCSPL